VSTSGRRSASWRCQPRVSLTSLMKIRAGCGGTLAPTLMSSAESLQSTDQRAHDPDTALDQDNGDHGHDDQHDPQRSNLRVDTVVDVIEDLHGLRGKARANQKERNDNFIERHQECQRDAGDKAWNHEPKRNP